jgi:2-keto-4-pentenoate hydratase/2-oxohepta-3-ene-1,7-dioic acid hydratase in catechol pathway
MRIVRYADGAVRWGVLEEDGAICPLRGTPFEPIVKGGPATHLDKVRLLTPVEPRAVYCIGLNYLKHAHEAKLPVPEVPLVFMKPPGAVIGPETPIVYPREGQTVHYEGEVAVVIGRTARRVSEGEALQHVLGYTCGNDVSERVIQRREMKQGALTMGKGFDTFCPIGPAIATNLDPRNIGVVTRVNGAVKQSSNTSDLIFTVAQLVSQLSAAMTLFPGDVIMSGTPEGVGPLLPGDTVEVEVSGVGVLRNGVVAEQAGAAERT